MNKLFLVFVVCGGICAQTPTPTGLAIHQPSHGSVSIEFRQSGPAANALRARTSVPGGSCTSGTGGSLSYQGGNNQGVATTKFHPYDTGSGPSTGRAVFAGLTPNTTYELCPELSADNGVTWSKGVGIQYTTQSLPAIHPAPPLPPAPVDTAYPDTTGYTTVSATCSSLSAEIANAEARQITTGTVINLPDCDNTPIQFAKAADNITFNTANINLANNTIGNPSYPGGGCGSAAGQIPCLTEGMAIRFGNYYAYQNTWPSHLHDPGHNANGAIPYVFYVHFPNAGDTNHFQIFYPQPYNKCATCLWTLGDQGNGANLMFVEWPRPLKHIVLRTPTPESSFAPAGTRITPAWDSKMAHFRNWNVQTGDPADGNQTTQIGNFVFVGIHFSFLPTGEKSPRPVTFQTRLSVQQSEGPITFDRCWFEGPQFPDRVAILMDLDGAGVGIVNSRIDKMYAWHPTSTWEGVLPIAGTGVPEVHSGASFTIPPGEFHGGPFNYVQTGTMHVSLSGSPAGGSGRSGFVYVDTDGSSIKIATPPGVTATTDIGTSTATAIDNARDASCDMNMTMVPKDGFGRPTLAPIACFYIGSNGQLTDAYYDYIGNNLSAVVSAAVQGPSCDWNGCEGSDTIIAGRGPGPLKLDNNFFNWNGNFLNVDDCLNPGPCALDVGDYTIRRNYFFHDFNTVRSSPNWNGQLQLHRQGVEWKHGSRDWVIGNIFDGPNGCDNQNPTGTGVLGKTGAGDVNDLNVEFNTFRHTCGVSGAGTYYFNGDILHDAMSRIRFANNLAYDISGWKYSSYYGPSTYHGSVGWLFQMGGGLEDFQVVHNTFMDNDGLKPAWFALRETAEGVTIDNNVFFYAKNPGASAVIFDAAYTDAQNHSAYTSCQTLSDKALLDCMWTNYTFRNNVIIPGNDSSNVWASSCDGGSTLDGPGCLARRNLAANAQVSYSAVSSAFAGSASTVLNLSGGVASAIAALKLTNPSKSNAVDYRPRSDSPIVSGGTYKGTDGKDVGADIDALERAQGKVTLSGVSNITTNAAVVSFLAPDTQSCPVDYSPTDPSLITSFTRVVDTGSQPGNRTVNIGGLTTGTSYYFRVNCAVEQPAGTFHTK